MQTHPPGMFHSGCHDYLYFLVTVLVINILPLSSKSTLFACSVKMALSLSNSFSALTCMMLSFSVEGAGKALKEERVLLPGSGSAAG